MAHPRVINWYADLERKVAWQRRFEQEMDSEEALSSYYDDHDIAIDAE